MVVLSYFFFFQAEDGIRDVAVTGVQTCALPILAITYAARGVTVNAICPGAVQTGLRANSTRILGADAPEMRGVGGDEAAVRAITPAGRRGTLDEVAAAACYLASEEADYGTGHTLVIDRGWTAR